VPVSGTAIEMLVGEYTGFFLFFGAMVGVGLLFIILSHAAQIIVKGEVSSWDKPYECGLRSPGLKLDRFPIHYYLVGILFVIFDVETVFLVPWALVGREFRDAHLGMFWFVEMLVFLIILVLGYMFLLQRGIFDWGHKSDE
jgi:NADH-quinone oxidoreductase subunit A